MNAREKGFLTHQEGYPGYPTGTLRGKAKIKADLESKSKRQKKKRSDLKINPDTGVYSNYQNTYKPLSAKAKSKLTAKQRSGQDDVTPGWKVNKGPGGGLRPSRRPRKRSYV